MNSRILNVVKSGLIATVAMTVLMLVAPMMGMPKMPIGNMLANFMHVSVALGWILHFMIGLVLAAGYVFLFQPLVGGSSILKGALYALIPFFMAQLIVMPMMGAGVFASHTPAPILMVMGSLMGHRVYGVVLGWMAKESASVAVA
ncbi:MAG: DUF6789 family protein [Calditrichia bacterium]